MLLGGIRYLLPVIEEAHKLGVHVITADYLPDNIAHKFSDEYVNVSIIDRDAVLKIAMEKQIDGIMSFGVDPGVVTAAYVSEKMGLPTPPLRSVEILQNKVKFRDFLLDNGFNCPWHKGYRRMVDAIVDYENGVLKLPAFVKPVDSAGSKGCGRANDREELGRAIDAALSESLSGGFIIEEYLELRGNQSSSDCFSLNNELVYFTLGSQFFDLKSPNPVAPVGNIWPSGMPILAQAELRKELQRLVKLLNLGTTIMNMDARIATDGKVYIMEVSPRGGGNCISEVLRYATKQDLIKASVLAALGRKNEILLGTPEYDGVWAYYVMHSNVPGRVAASAEIDSDFKRRHVIKLNECFMPGDCVGAFTGANKSLGTVILRFDNYQEAKMAINDPSQWMNIKIV
ncbi:MAG: ATP-grasp domain-containing protein [Kiritimatiellae bacterium]|nr:ATP-grasp domain-containing protein [Kiritimatiellia bacterium]